MRADVFQFVFGDKCFTSLVPIGDLIDTTAGIFIEGDVIAFNEFRMCIFNKIRKIFRGVLTGLSDIITESVHHFMADAIEMCIRDRS